MQDQVLIRDRQGKMGGQLNLLTTNNFPDKLNQIISNFQNKSYKIDTYYTDEVGFQEALKRYDQMLNFDAQLELREDYRLKVRGRKAIDLILDTLKNRTQFSEVDLINELMRL